MFANLFNRFFNRPKFPDVPRQGDVLFVEQPKTAMPRPEPEELARVILTNIVGEDSALLHNPDPAFNQRERQEIMTLTHGWGHWKTQFCLQVFAHEADLTHAEVQHAAVNLRVAKQKLEDYIKSFVAAERIDAYQGMVIQSMAKTIVDWQIGQITDKLRQGIRADDAQAQAPQVDVVKNAKRTLREYLENVRRLRSE